MEQEQQQEERELHACLVVFDPALLISCKPNANAGNLARSSLLSWPASPSECCSQNYVVFATSKLTVILTLPPNSLQLPDYTLPHTFVGPARSLVSQLETPMTLLS